MVKLKKWMSVLLCAVMTALCLPAADDSAVLAKDVRGQEVQADREKLDFRTDWLYSNVDYANGESVKLDDSGFEPVSVPHANTIIPDHKGEDFLRDIASYRFVSWYRRHFTLPGEYAGRTIMVEFEGVATVAEVYLNGKLLATHEGAYTGFTVDISDAVYTDGRDNVLAVRVDSTRQPELPPEGGSVDYCLFGGIVRDVTMTITSPVYVEQTFVTTPGLETGKNVVNTQVEIRNSLAEDKTYTVAATVKDKDGNPVKTASEDKTLAAGETTTVTVETAKIDNVHLWSPDDPYLYTLTAEVKDGDTVVDSYDTAFGMRYFEFADTDTDKSFYLNGEKTEIIGINRHEQWPWIGRAVCDKLQVQDADLIKAQGINAVRCSHYPQDPSFMDRCDEIGLLVFTEPPGWQHIGETEWKENFKRNLVELIERDRNHPSVISWGVTPNESEAQSAEVQKFNQDCQKIAKELDPTRPTHGVRWEFFFDNHVKNGTLEDIATDLLTVNYRYPGMNNNRDENLLSTFDKPYLVTEHSNECWFNGGGVPGTTDALMLQFVDSFAKYVDYFYENDLVAGGFGWSMFDYNNEVNYTNTGHVFYSGLYDIFRHEKPVALAYRTQQDIEDAGEMVYIANKENGNSNTSTSTVYVFSNCEEVELFAGGVSQGKIKPNKYMNLPHPVYEFTNVKYAGKELKAVGYVNGKAVKEDVKAVPGAAVRLIAEADYDTLTADGTDLTSVSVTAVDADGNAVPFASDRVNVVQKSGVKATLISEDNVALEGGKVSFLVQSVYGKTGTATFEVTSGELAPAEVSIDIDAFTAGNLVPVSEGNGTEKPEFPKLYILNDSTLGINDYQFNYQGSGWQCTQDQACYAGDNTWSETTGDYFTIPFTGNSIRYYAVTAPNHGVAAVSVDDGEEVLVDLYSAARQGNTLVYDSGVLQSGRHVLKVRVTGQKNAASGGNFVTVDRTVICGESSSGNQTETGMLRGTYYLAVDGTTQRMCMNGDSTEAGAEVLTWPDETSDNYRWTLKRTSDTGIYQLINENSKLLLTMKGDAAVQDAENGEDSQLFVLEYADHTKNSYRIKNVASGKYLALGNVAYDKGYYVVAADYAENAAIWTKTAATVEPDMPYVDVDTDSGNWYYDAVYYNYLAETMTGTDPTHFAPLDYIRRAQFAIIIHRMSGEPEVTYKAVFPDIENEIWYTDAIIWASDAEIVTGYSDTGLFGPANYINREQMAVMMYRYAKYLKLDVSKKADFDAFEDAANVTGYAQEAMQWAIGTGIIAGKYNGTKIDPQGNALRAECAIIIQRFMELYKI